MCALFLSLACAAALCHPALRPTALSVCPLGRFKNTFQSGFLSILYSIGASLCLSASLPLCLSARDCLLSFGCARAHGLAGSKPLQIWERKVQNGHIKRITDNDIQSSVLEIMSTNISTTFVSCPADAGKTLGIKLPFLVMIIKNVRAATSDERRPVPARCG